MIKRSSLTRFLILSVVLILGLAACGAENTPVNPVNNPTDTPQILLTPAPNPHLGYASGPVAQVNNQPISASDFNHALDLARVTYEQANGGLNKINWSSPDNQQALQDLRGQTLEGLINFAVVSEQAAKEGVTVSEAEVEARLADFKKQLGNNPNAYPNWLAQHYITDADERTELRQTILFEKMQAKHSATVADKAEQVHVRFILLATQTEAIDIYNKLKSGANFVTLANQFSLDPGTAPKGGDLGFIWAGSTDPEFEKVAFALQTNEVSQPVKTSLGWNIIQSLGKEIRALPFDLVQQRKSDTFAAYIKFLRDQAKIEELLKP